jgi:hypothetical protein
MQKLFSRDPTFSYSMLEGSRAPRSWASGRRGGGSRGRSFSVMKDHSCLFCRLFFGVSSFLVSHKVLLTFFVHSHKFLSRWVWLLRRLRACTKATPCTKAPPCTLQGAGYFLGLIWQFSILTVMHFYQHVCSNAIQAVQSPTIEPNASIFSR